MQPPWSRARYVKWSLVLIGIFLACVGIFHVDDFFWIHNSVATGMAVVFALLVFRMPAVVPGLPRAFFVVGFIFIAVIATVAVFFAIGYYNLTAVEIVAFALIFTWLIVLIRMVSAAATDAATDAAQKPPPTALAARPGPDRRLWPGLDELRRAVLASARARIYRTAPAPARHAWRCGRRPTSAR